MRDILELVGVILFMVVLAAGFFLYENYERLSDIGNLALDRVEERFEPTTIIEKQQDRIAPCPEAGGDD